jgi:hypothetical protein
MDAIIFLFINQVIDFSIYRTGDGVLLVGGVMARRGAPGAERGLR